MDKSTVGELLREGRLRQRLSIMECARRTHIAARYIEALEEERWDALPSESHRLGFLQLYSRFLGVPADEILVLYRQVKPSQPVAEKPETVKKEAAPQGARHAWEPTTWQQWVLLLIFVLVAAWGIYHAVGKPLSGPQVYSWARFRPHRTTRLTPVNRAPVIQHLRIVSQAPSWLRVVEDNRLLFEGNLPGGMTKEWNGQGPFAVKIGDVHSVAVYWNDQPIDLVNNARGNISDLKLPLPK